MILKNKSSVIAVVIAVLIVLVNILTVMHIREYAKTEDEIDTFILGLPDTMTVVNHMNDEEYDETVIDQSNEHYIRILHLTEELFCSADHFEPYTGSIESLDIENEDTLKFTYSRLQEVSLPLENGSIEIDVRSVQLLLTAKRDGACFVIETDSGLTVYGLPDYPIEYLQYVRNIARVIEYSK